MRGLNPEVNYLNSCEIKIHFEILNKIKITNFSMTERRLYIFIYFI